MARAISEATICPRTWWGTLTYSGEAEPSYRQVQQFLKLVRLRDPIARYLVTEERGSEKGRLHWHVLVHGGSWLQKRHLEQCWPAGFTKFRLAKSKGLAGYMAKYAGKAGAGMRSSPYYGKWKFHLSDPVAPISDDDYMYLRALQLTLIDKKRFRKKKLKEKELALIRAIHDEMNSSPPVVSVKDAIRAATEQPNDAPLKTRLKALRVFYEVDMDTDKGPPLQSAKVTPYDYNSAAILRLLEEEQSNEVLGKTPGGPI